MNVKKINEICGYAIFALGALKILLVILIFIQLSTNMMTIFDGGEIADSDYYPVFSTAIGAAQLILAVVSIIMIFVNIKKQPGVISGYLLGLGAVLIEFLMPPILFLFTVFIECGMYMKAGNKIRKNASGYEVEHKISKQMLQNTDWFYGDTNEQSEKEQIQDQKRRDKLEKELSEWKELLESGEIDEETYQQETSQLIEKEKRRSERKKK